MTLRQRHQVFLKEIEGHIIKMMELSNELEGLTAIAKMLDEKKGCDPVIKRQLQESIASLDKVLSELVNQTPILMKRYGEFAHGTVEACLT